MQERRAANSTVPVLSYSAVTFPQQLVHTPFAVCSPSAYSLPYPGPETLRGVLLSLGRSDVG